MCAPRRGCERYRICFPRIQYRVVGLPLRNTCPGVNSRMSFGRGIAAKLRVCRPRQPRCADQRISLWHARIVGEESDGEQPKGDRVVVVNLSTLTAQGAGVTKRSDWPRGWTPNAGQFAGATDPVTLSKLEFRNEVRDLSPLTRPLPSKGEKIMTCLLSA